MKWLYLVPKKTMSFVMGKIAHIRWPKAFNTWLILKFAEFYKINLEESEFEVSKYVSLGDFFVRHLKASARPLGVTWALHPADSELTQLGRITQGRIVYAKDRGYSLQDFLRDSRAHEKFAVGQFLTYYLCPADYHRVHSPVDGEITRVVHVPGHLWPVNAWAVEHIDSLFAVNERVVLEIKTDRGPVAVVFVGATNVGSIEITALPELKTNTFLQSSAVREYEIKTAIPVRKGEELGLFRMGSTVVVVYPQVVLGSEPLPKKVKVRASIDQ